MKEEQIDLVRAKLPPRKHEIASTKNKTASFESITPEAPDVITRADKALPPPISKELSLS
jgi:hypothetical protein